MTKRELVSIVAKRTQQPTVVTKEVLEATLNLIAQILYEGDKVVLSGFGTFMVRKRSAKRGRNPKTGKRITLPAHELPHFFVGKSLKELINKKT